MALTDLSKFSKLVVGDVLHCPDPLVTHALRQTIIDFYEKTWICHHMITSTVSSITADINDYAEVDVSSYVTDKVVFAIEEFRINGIEWRLKYGVLDDDSTYINYLRDEDQKIYSIPSANKIRIHELSVGDELFIKAIFKPISTITGIDDEIYNNWLDTIIAGTKARLLPIPNQPWTNGGLASAYRLLYRGGLSEAKRKIGKQYTREPGSVKWRRFGE